MFRVRTQIGCNCVPSCYTGNGVVAAVLDTGISPHPDFDSRIAGFMDFVNGRTGLYDDSGHGTHVVG